MRSSRFAVLAAVALATSGCASAVVEPGHRGLFFAPSGGGLRHEVLAPGRYGLGACFIACNRIDDFDVTYSARTERVKTRTREGLELELTFRVLYRPIISELYQLDTEIGPAYYDEVVGPEVRSACRGVVARHSFSDAPGALQDELEAELRRRIAGKHVEVASIAVESAAYAPEIAESVRRKVAVEQELERQRAAMNAEFAVQKLRAEHEAELRRIAGPPVCTGPGAAASPGEPPR